jgi:hypothetical protein
MKFEVQECVLDSEGQQAKVKGGCSLSIFLHDINALSVLHGTLRYRQVANHHSCMKIVGGLWRSAPNDCYACQQLKCDGLILYILQAPPICFQCHRLEAEQAMFRFGDTAAWLSEAERQCPVDPVLDTGTPST